MNSTCEIAERVSAEPARGALVARLPIFDRRHHVHAYELVFDRGREALDSPGQTTRDVLKRVGLNRLAGHRQVLLPFDQNLFLEGFYRSLPEQQVVLELSESLGASEETIAICRQVSAAHHRLSLGAYVAEPDYQPLLKLAEILRVDLRRHSAAEAHELIRTLRRSDLTFLASGVDSYTQLEQARSLGFRLFQGAYFCRPAQHPPRAMSTVQQHCLHLIQQVAARELDISAIEQAIESEPGLSDRLMRYIASMPTEVRKEVGSVQQGVMLLGPQRVRVWAPLLAMMLLTEDRAEELVRVSLARARFCGCVGAELAWAERSGVELYLLGLLSALDALLDRPMTGLVAHLPVAAPVKRAWLDASTPEAKLLLLATACERGEWRKAKLLAKLLGLSEARLGELHFEAMMWADATIAGELPEVEAG